MAEIKHFDERRYKKYFGDYCLNLRTNNNEESLADLLAGDADLAGVPLLAKMLKELALRGKLSSVTNRAELFDCFANEIFKQAAGHELSEVGADGKDSRYFHIRLRPLIEKLAYHLIAEAKIKSEFPRDKLYEFLGEHGKHDLGSDVIKTGLLRPVRRLFGVEKIDTGSDELIDWQHQNFLEYFAACRLDDVRRRDEKKFFDNLDRLGFEEQIANFLTENQKLSERQRRAASESGYPVEADEFILIPAGDFVFSAYNHANEQPVRKELIESVFFAWLNIRLPTAGSLSLLPMEVIKGKNYGKKVGIG